MACCSLTQSANAPIPRDATLVSRVTISFQVPPQVALSRNRAAILLLVTFFSSQEVR